MGYSETAETQNSFRVPRLSVAPSRCVRANARRKWDTPLSDTHSWQYCRRWPVCEALQRFEEAPDVFREWMQMIGIEIGGWPEQPPPGGQADIFWKIMLNDSVELNTNESLFYRRTNEDDYAQLRNLWLMLLSPLGGFLASELSPSLKSHDDLMSQALSTIYHILVCLWHRRLSRIEKGYIGLAPENSGPGDESTSYPDLSPHLSFDD